MITATTILAFGAGAIAYSTWLCLGKPTFCKVLTCRKLTKQENKSDKTIIAAVIRTSLGFKQIKKFYPKKFEGSYEYYYRWMDLDTGKRVSGSLDRKLDRVLEICELQNDAFLKDK
jgi:hypothetical protein